MKNQLLSDLFSQMADITEILGDDHFRITTYRKVARIIEDQTEDIEAMLADGSLEKIPGIGKSSLAKIQEFVQTQSITAHKELLKKIPESLLELLKIPGVGPKGVKAVYEQLKVKNIADLKNVIHDGSLAELPGFGEKKVAAIEKGIHFLETSTGRIRIDQALEAAQIVIEFLKNIPGVRKIEIAGSLRRRLETIGDVDILFPASDGSRIINDFTKAPFVQEILASGPTKGSAVIETPTSPVHVDVRVIDEESFGAALQYFTGSKEHNVLLRELAIKKGLKLNEYGLFKDDKIIAAGSEEQIFRALNMDYIDPRLREDRGEIDAARNHSLPSLITLKDMQGDMHVHTKASDGSYTISEMAQAAKNIGLKYICITDHSKSSAIANGLSPKRLEEHIKQIREANEQIKGFTILAGTEVDILADGSIDFDNSLLAELDFVVASVHSGLASPREKVTARTLKAMDNPYIHCIGHPTGRLIGQREPMDIDIFEVIKHAARTHTALELNAHPMRLDLKDIHCKMAVEQGVKLVISTDSHSVDHFDLMRFGIDTAARGWVTKENVLNTNSAKYITDWAKKKLKA